MSTKPLPRSTPSQQGVDAGGIRSFIDALEEHPHVEPHGVMIVRHDSVIAEGWWAPYSSERQHLLYSLSKSFTATALGFAIAEGLVDLDDTVLSHFPELDGEITDPRSRRMRVRHVAAMASGHREETVDRALSLDPVDMVRGFLLIPPDEEPGHRFTYNQPCTFAIAAIVQRRSGMSLTEYLRPRLFDPLGIGEVGWKRDASDRELGYSGLYATTEDVAKLGQLHLRHGELDGRRLLDPAWVAEATRTQVENPSEPNVDWRQGYGFQFWMARHGYRGDGAYGQFCVVLPDQDVVLAVTSQSDDMQAVLDAAWTHLLPAIGDRPGGADEEATAADAALAGRLSSLGLPPTRGDGPPADWTSLAFAPAPGNDQPGLREITIGSPGSGALTWTVALLDSGDRIDAAFGIGAWEVAGAIAASGAWHGDLLDVDVVFVETPHRLRLSCDSRSGLFEARWVTAPLHDSRLEELRMPRR